MDRQPGRHCVAGNVHVGIQRAECIDDRRLGDVRGRQHERVGLDGQLDCGTETAVDWFNNILGPEDVEIVESVQRGLHSMGYKRGRLMVDPGQKEVWSEHFLHHFNTLNVKAVTRGG